MTRVAVIGSGVAGLTAAGLLAKRGREVVLFEQGDVLGGKAGRFETNGLVFDTGPTLLAMPHLISSVFADLGAPMPKLYRLPVQCHYIWQHGATLDVFDALEPTLASAERLGSGLGEFYAEAERIYRLLGEPYLAAPLESFLAFAQKLPLASALLGLRLSTLDRLIRRFVRSPELEQMLGRFATYVGASPYAASAAYAMISHVERAFGVHHPEGGMGALVQALAVAVLDTGVVVRTGRRVDWSRQGNGFVVDGERFDQVIVNADPTAHGASLSLSAYVLFLHMRAEPGLWHHTILFSRNPRAEFAALFRGELPDDATLYLCRPGTTDRTMPKDALYVMVNTPPAAFDTAPLRQRVLRAIAPHTGHVEVIGERTPADFERLGAPRGALYGSVAHGRFGPFRRPRMRGAHPGQFFAGGGTHPGGGVPLVALSGRFAADLALAEDRA